MLQIDLSVIIPVYNAAPLLERCLNSIFIQTTQYSYEVILVDDGSTDKSVEIIKARSEENIVLYQQQNAGPSVARNKGVELSMGRYCAYLDADDYWEDGYIEKTVSFLDSHQDCVAVNVAQKHCIYGEAETIVPFCFANFEESFVLDDFYSFWAKNNHVCTGSVMMRRKDVIMIKGQRADMRVCEDLEFWLLLATRGHWGFIPEVLFVSDGGIIVSTYGWKKYVLRFRNVPFFTTWFSRLKNTLSQEQIDTIKPQLNGIICGISRAMISGGDFKRAYDNLKLIYPDVPSSYIIKIHRLGIFPWYTYCMLWRMYQYQKINKGVVLHKLHIK